MTTNFPTQKIHFMSAILTAIAQKSRLYLISLITFTSILSACSGSLPTISASNSSNKDTLASLTTEAATAGKQASPAREQQLILIAQRLLTIGELDQAQAIVESFDYKKLSDGDYAAYVVTASDIYTQQQSILNARILLTEPRLDTVWDRLSINEQKHIHLARADIFNQTGQTQDNLNERIALATLLSEKNEIDANNEAIWQQLSLYSEAELNQLSSATSNQVLSGWYALGAVSKQYQDDLETQNLAILNWKRTNPNHPASLELPADLKILETLITERPKNIALLLPLSGKLAKAGETIRDGFFAAYYRAQENQKNLPDIKVYDTSKEDINSVYDQATLNGSDLIIGPLDKQNVASLQQRSNLPVPTLALNYSATNNKTNNSSTPLSVFKRKPIDNKPFFQFGLSLADEAVQAAERAWLEGHRYALVLASTADWSQRAADAFMIQWEKYGGKVVQNSHFDRKTNYSENISTALGINQSKKRANALKRLFGRTFEFEPRRRGDIDMIFLVSRSREGRQIKPTLNFHYASRIPVYATSQIYSSLNSADKNSDLNGIRFTTLPWVIDQKSKADLAIDGNVKVGPGYERLYALGVDSFLLYPRLRQLQQLPDQQIHGTTGKLSLTPGKRIKRKQLWAEIYKGQIRPLPELVLSKEKIL